MREPTTVTTDGAGDKDSPAPSRRDATPELDARGKAILRAFDSLIERRPGDPAVVFGQLCSRLRRRLRIWRGLLFVLTENPKALQSYALWDEGALSSGVLVTVPPEDSQLWELLETGCAKTYTPAHLFSGNLIETKLVDSVSDGALTLWPLLCEDRPVGLVALNCQPGARIEADEPLLRSALVSFACYLSAVPHLTGPMSDIAAPR